MFGSVYSCRLLLLGLNITLLSLSLSAQNIEWAKHYGGTAGDNLNGLIADTNGNIYISGTFENTATFDTQTLTSIGEQDLYIAQIDDQQQVNWAVRAGSTEDDENAGLAIYNNTIYTAGSYWDTADFGNITINRTQGSNSALYLAKYDANGNALWAISIDGSGIKQVDDIEIDKEGNVYLTGYFGGTLFTNSPNLIASGNTSFFVLKYDENGNLIWAKQSGDNGDVRGSSLSFDVMNNVYAGGRFQGDISFAGQFIAGNGLDNDIFLLKYDNNGNEQWIREGGGVFDDVCNEIISDENGNTYLTGYFSGVIRWEDGTELVAQGFYDNIVLVKHDSSGNLLWAKSIDGDGNGYGQSLVLNGNRLFLGGQFRGEKDFDGSVLSADDIRFDIFTAALDVNGNFEWLIQGGGSEFDLLECMTFLPEYGLILGGSFDGNTVLGNENLSAFGSFDAFIAGLTDFPLAVFNNHVETIRVYPNPANNYLHFDLPDNTLVRIFNHRGQLIQSSFIQNSIIDTSRLLSGVYFVQIETERVKCLGHFVKF